VSTSNGKLTIDLVKKCIKRIGDQHYTQAKVVSISQPTEYGTVYTIQELKELSDYAHSNHMIFHVDGARIANAVAYLGCPIHELTMTAGIDVLSFGGTKNGIMLGEAVVFFDKQLSIDFKYYRKQSMQLVSKMRYISAQFDAL